MTSTRFTAPAILVRYVIDSHRYSANSTSISNSGCALTPRPLSPASLGFDFIFNENLLRKGEPDALAMASYATVSH